MKQSRRWPTDQNSNVKRRLIFEEDAKKEDEPSCSSSAFLAMIESSSPIPTFKQSQAEDKERESQLEQLENVMGQMFDLLKDEVEPAVADK